MPLTSGTRLGSYEIGVAPTQPGGTTASRVAYAVTQLPEGETLRTSVRQILPVPGASWGQQIAITPDGSAYAMTYTAGQSDLFRVTGLK